MMSSNAQPVYVILQKKLSKNHLENVTCKLVPGPFRFSKNPL